MLTRSLSLLLLLLACLVPQGAANAWGERGHNLLTRVAVRLVLTAADPQFAAAFPDKELMLGHISNVPDIVWRNLPELTKDNAPTHYVDLERVSPTLTMAEMPSSIPALEEQMARYCAKDTPGFQCPPKSNGHPTAAMAGTAPFRAAQFFKLMVAALAKAKAAAPRSPAFTAAVDDALLYAGLMSHFVGDMGQPYHATTDYDGYRSGHGGIHSYFESDLVNAQDLGFDQEVFEQALKTKPIAQQEPLAVSFALALDSYAHLAAMNDLDRRFAVLKPSREDHGMQLKAERRPAGEVAPHFRGALRDRLALSASTLAQLWTAAWVKAGKPDLRGFQSFTYPVAPAFIKLDY